MQRRTGRGQQAIAGKPLRPGRDLRCQRIAQQPAVRARGVDEELPLKRAPVRQIDGCDITGFRVERCVTQIAFDMGNAALQGHLLEHAAIGDRRQVIGMAAAGKTARFRLRHEEAPMTRGDGIERKVVIRRLKAPRPRLDPIVMKRHASDRLPMGTVALNEGRMRVGEIGETLAQTIGGLRRRHKRTLVDPHQLVEGGLVRQGGNDVGHPQAGWQFDRHDLKARAVERGP